MTSSVAAWSKSAGNGGGVFTMPFFAISVADLAAACRAARRATEKAYAFAWMGEVSSAAFRPLLRSVVLRKER